MKNKFLIIIFLSIYILPCIPTNGQNSYERQIKYWYLRDRLRHFIVPSDDPLSEKGTFLVMTSRNRNYEDKETFTTKADYGQEMSMYGKYIGVLATEYYLLNQSGRYLEADLTNNELVLALKAYERLDLCEDYLDPPLPFPLLDGFFIRHDVPDPGDPSTPSQFLANSEVNTDVGLLLEDDPLFDENNELREVLYIAGDMTPYQEKMSQDEVCFLLEGLALAFKFGSPEVQTQASFYAMMLFQRLYGHFIPGIHHQDWRINDHLGQNIICDEGGCCQLMSYGYTKAAENFFGFYGIFDPFLGSETYWDGLLILGSGGSDAHMIAGMAAIGRVWGNQTPSGIFRNTDQDGWDYYYLWLLKALWDESYSYYDVDRIEDRLDEGSCVGPWAKSTNEHALHGWGSPDRWRYNIGNQCVDGQPGGIGIYSGLDYMLLLNLYYICNGDGLTRYRNRITTLLDQNWPQGNVGSIYSPYLIEAFRGIVSTDRLLGSPLAADITYQAGESILLNPGFRVYPGAHFHAKIQPVDYCSILPQNHGSCHATDLLSSKSIDNGDRNQTSVYLDPELLTGDVTNMISEDLSETVIVHPNPGKGYINVSNVNTFNDYKLHSSQGDIIMEGAIDSDNFSLNLTNCRAGLYVLILQSSNQFCIKKVSIID